LKNVPAWNTTFVTVLGKSRTVVQNVIDTLLASDLIPGDGDGNSMINKYGLSRQSGHRDASNTATPAPAPGAFPKSNPDTEVRVARFPNQAAPAV
jgi:hypothetical protein